VVNGPRVLAEQLGQQHQRFISGRMAILVVEFLEMVDVQHQQGQLLVVAPGPLHLFLKDTVEKTAVVEAGQLILQGRSLFLGKADFPQNRLFTRAKC
jgi:hypothetical protein